MIEHRRKATPKTDNDATESSDTAFLVARARAMETTATARTDGGKIGVYREKLLHSTLKYYYQPDNHFHEIALPAGCVADAVRDHEAFEIQTGGFFPLKAKLDRYLPAGQSVRIVCPLVRKKWIVWIDPVTGDAEMPHKSPRTGGMCDVLYELNRLTPYLGNPLLKIDLLLIDIQEYRCRNGWGNGGKRGSERMERYPVALAGRVTLQCADDYAVFLPEALSAHFTVAEYARESRLSVSRAGTALRFLRKQGTVTLAGKRGRANLYTRADLS